MSIRNRFFVFLFILFFCCSSTAYATKGENDLPRYKPASKPYITPAYMKSNPYMYFKKDGHYLWVRSPFNATTDLVQKLTDVPTTAYSNPLFNFSDTELLANTVPLTFAQSWAGTVYHDTSDDICPLNYNGHYIGANHGAEIVRVLTVASHDKTDADLGSIWQDAGAKRWTLVRVESATLLHFAPDLTTDAEGAWVVNLTIGASPLTHVSGATHTSNVVYSSTAIGQMKPIVKDVSQKFLVDGQIDAVDGSVYRCAFLDVIQEYDISDPRTVLAYMKANIGKTIIEAVADASVTEDAHMLVRYRFYPNGSCVIYHEVNTVSYLKSMTFGGVQSGALAYSGKKLYQYIPRVAPYVGSLKTWDFTAIEEIDTTIEILTFLSTKWKDTNKPPFRSTQILKDSSNVPILGFSLGFSLSKLDTVDATRKVKAGTAFYLHTSRKQYPYARGSNWEPGGQTFKALCFRGYFDPNNINGATVCQYHEEGNELIVDIDYHTNVDRVCLPIPAGWNGKTVTILHSDGGITVHTTTVNGNGIIVTVTGGYGSATIKVS